MDRKIIDYQMCAGNTHQNLNNNIREYCPVPEWQPYGKPFTADTWCHQAMVKYEEKAKEKSSMLECSRCTAIIPHSLSNLGDQCGDVMCDGILGLLE